MYLGILDLTLM